MEDNQTVKISVVIPAHNSSKTIRKTIEAVLNQNYKKNKIETIVIDDGSTDNTKDIAMNYSIKYIYQENGGPSAARNKGWQNANGDVICFTDSDCIPEKEWVAKILNNYTSDDIGGVGGSYDINNKNSLLSRLIHEEIAYRHSKMPKVVDYLGSFNVSYRRHVLEEVGGFDETYKKASGEDNDLAYRIKKKGYKLIFDKNIKVAHNYPENILKYLRQQFIHGFWRVRLHLRHMHTIKGDCYSSFFDYIQPPLALFTLFFAPFVYLSKTLMAIITFIMIGLFVMTLPMSISIVQKRQNMEYLLLAPLTFIRSYARGLGMFFGLLFYRMHK